MTGQERFMLLSKRTRCRLSRLAHGCAHTLSEQAIHLRILCGAAGVVLLFPQSSLAQAIDVGAQVGIGMNGSESQLAKVDEPHPFVAVHAGLWIRDRLEIMPSVAWYHDATTTRGSRHFFRQTPVVLETRQGTRQLLGAALNYHFRRGERTRPYAGVGVGVIRDQLVTFCGPDSPACEADAPSVPFGENTDSYADLVFQGGVQRTVGERLLLRGSVQWHVGQGDELSVFSALFGIGYRLRE